MIEQYFIIEVKAGALPRASEHQIQSATEHVNRFFSSINKQIVKRVKVGEDRLSVEIRYMDDVMAMTDALFSVGILVNYERREVNIHDISYQ